MQKEDQAKPGAEQPTAAAKPRLSSLCDESEQGEVSENKGLAIVVETDDSEEAKAVAARLAQLRQSFIASSRSRRPAADPASQISPKLGGGSKQSHAFFSEASSAASLVDGQNSSSSSVSSSSLGVVSSIPGLGSGETS